MNTSVFLILLDTMSLHPILFPTHQNEDKSKKSKTDITVGHLACLKSLLPQIAHECTFAIHMNHERWVSGRHHLGTHSCRHRLCQDQCTVCKQAVDCVQIVPGPVYKQALDCVQNCSPISILIFTNTHRDKIWYAVNLSSRMKFPMHD